MSDLQFINQQQRLDFEIKVTGRKANVLKNDISRYNHFVKCYNAVENRQGDNYMKKVEYNKTLQ